MGKLFDPHYHTIQSDGDSKILESVDAAKRAGLAALIITDHLNRFGYTDSYRTNKNLVTTLTGPHKPDKYPIIIGMEFGLPPAVGFGEVLIFGTEICQAIQNNLAEINNFDLAEFKKLKDRHKCAIVQCHPNKEATGVDERILQIIDACEITRSGNAHYNYEKILEDCKKKGITPVASSDGHIAYRDSELIYEV
ncbi:MAG: PHP domain-containing protein, partial [Candidatus Woesearchaeota archaeon]